MRTCAAVLFFAFAVGLIFALGCTPIYLVALPDGGRQQVFPQPDGGIVIDFDGGTTSCLPNPGCIITSDAGSTACHAGFQECLADGTLGACTPYGNCPAPASTCNGFVDLFFILDDSSADVSPVDFIIAQSAIQLYTFENQQWNYLYGLQDVPGCTWSGADAQGGLERASTFLPFISVQCVANAPAPDVALAVQQVTANTPWVAPNGQLQARFIFVFTDEPFKSETQIVNVKNQIPITVIYIGYFGQTVDGLFNLLTGSVVCD